MMGAPVLQATGLYARDAAGMVLGLDLSLPSGTVGALLGTPQDGTSVLAHVLAGCAAPSAGSVLVGEQAPLALPGVRARIGALLEPPLLPDLGTVRQLLAWSRALRGEHADRSEWLEGTGAAGLLGVAVRALDGRQRKTVALALALAVPSPLLLVLHEPLSSVVRAEPAWLREQLRARAQRGACVLVMTASTHDAVALADDVATLQRGRIGRAIGAPEVDQLAPGAALELRVWTERAREVAALLAIEPSIKGVWLSDQPGAPLVLQTVEPKVAAAQVARVVTELGAELRGLQTVLPGGAQVHEATLRMITRSGAAS